MSRLLRFARNSALLGVAVLGFALANAPDAALAQGFISGSSPNPDGGDSSDPLAVTACNRAPQKGVVYRNSESEPHLAVNPTNPLNLIAGWHQDRWSTGGAQSLGAAYSTDGGAKWQGVVIPFTRCSGAVPGSAGDYERASDPWISFSPNGTAHYMALVTNWSVNANAMVTARSTDGGITWSPPVVIARNPAQDQVKRSLFHDKNTITADPHHSHLVYATWTLFRYGISSVVFARSTDGGRTWSPAKPIATMGNTAPGEHAFFRQGAQIVVLPNGTLVNAFYRILFDEVERRVRFEQAVLRSTDQGRHWSRVDKPVATFASVNAVDPESGVPVRDAGELPSIAASPDGQLYMTWQDANANSANSAKRAGIVIARSGDGGLTWSTPVRVTPVRGYPGTAGDEIQAFLPVVAVNSAGVVGVLFYDWRHDVLGDGPLSTDVWLSLFDENLNFIREHRLTSSSFDMRQMVITGARGFFPGDYVGLSTTGGDFVAAFTAANNLNLPVVFPQNNDGVFVDSQDRQSIVFVRQPFP